MAEHEEAPGVEVEAAPGEVGGESVLGKRNLEEEAEGTVDVPPPGGETEQPAEESAPAVNTDFQEASKRAAEIAARLSGGDPNKRPRTEGEEAVNGGHAETGRPTGFSDAPAGYTPAPTGFSDGPPGGAAYQAPVAQAGQFGELTRKVQIPNAKVGLVIGKGGETIKQLQYQSMARIQVTRDQDTPPGAQYREIEVVGTEEALAKAEQLINDIVNDVGGPGRALAAPGPDAVTMIVPNDKVGLIIGKGGETIKNLQNRSGARIQVQSDATLEPGATERTVTLSGGGQATAEAKRLIQEVISGERPPPRRYDDYGRGGYRSGPPGGQWGGPQGGYRPPGGPPPYGGYSAPAPAPYYGAPPQYAPQQYPGYDQSGYGYAQPAYGAAPAAPAAAAPAYDYSGYQQPAAAAGGYDYSQQYQGYQQPGYYQAPADPASQQYYQQPAADGSTAAPAATYDYSQGGAAPAAAPTQ